MGMTMSQKILAQKAGLEQVSAGDLVEARLDLVLGNDVTAPVAIEAFEKAGFTRVYDPARIVLTMDHFTPHKDIKAARLSTICRRFAAAQGIGAFFDVGEVGIEHALLPEQGFVAPGELIIGADSHTCTYGALGAFSTGVGSTDMAAAMATGKLWFKVPSAIRILLRGKPAPWVSGKDIILHIIGKIGVDGALYASMEYEGDGLTHLTMDDRFTMANMAVEAGAKNAIFPVDAQVTAYLNGRLNRVYEQFLPDPDAVYEQTIEIKLDKLKPTVAFPPLPSNIRTPDNWGTVKLDQVVIGSCTNGRIEDLRTAAQLLMGRKVAKGLRVIIIPATQQIYLEAMRLGYLESFLEAGCAVSTPTCGPCLGGHMGVLDEGERALATTNRNFVGRMGHPKSEVYLASPAVAAASAVLGKIASPNEL